MKARFSLVYNRRAKKLAATEKAPVHIEVYFSRTLRRWIPTHVEVEPRFWNAKTKIVKKDHPNYIGLYQMLKQQMDDLEKFELSLINQGRELTPQLLDAYLSGAKDSFIAFSRTYIDERLAQGKISKLSHMRYSNCLNLLAKIAGGNLLLTDVNEQLVKSIDTYLTARGYEQTTIGRFHLVVKMFIKVAAKKGHLDPRKSPYEEYVVDKGKSERNNLEPEELQLLENVDRKALDNPRLEQALDRFLYSCYTGLRIGDNILLSKKHIKKGSDGLVVDMVTEKGKGQRIVHHLAYLFEGKPQAIVEKYQKLYPDQPTVFSPETSALLNRYLKIVVQKAGIQRNITFHMARHTCGTMLADISANPYLIMDIMGHADINTSIIYIHRSSERVKKQLQNLTWKW